MQLEIDIKLSEHADFEIKNGDCAANKKALDKIELEITELKAQVLLKDNQLIEYSKRDVFQRECIKQNEHKEKSQLETNEKNTVKLQNIIDVLTLELTETKKKS